MSQHNDCRMYEPKYPEVDDVVMVQVGADRGAATGKTAAREAAGAPGRRLSTRESRSGRLPTAWAWLGQLRRRACRAARAGRRFAARSHAMRRRRGPGR